MNQLKCFVALIFIAAILWGCGSSQVKPSSGSIEASDLSSLSAAQLQIYYSALSDLKTQNPKSAEKKLQKLVLADSQNPEVLINLALSQYQQKEYNNARETLARVFSVSNNAAPAHNLAGLIAVEKGEFTLAFNHYNSALKIHSNYANALYNMALLQDVYFQDVKKAISFYERYSELAADDQSTRDWIEHLKRSLIQ